MKYFVRLLMLTLACLQSSLGFAQPASSPTAPQARIQNIITIASRAARADSSADERLKAVELIRTAAQTLSPGERNELIDRIIPALKDGIAPSQENIAASFRSSAAFFAAFLVAYVFTGGIFGTSSKFSRISRNILLLGGLVTLGNGSLTTLRLRAHIGEIIQALNELRMQNDFEQRIKELGTGGLT